MLLSLMLMAALEAQTPPPPPVAPAPAAQAPAMVVPTHNDAATLASSGDLEASLHAFQQIAAANPDDRGARIWIANLHVQMRHLDRAEPVYRSVLLEDPADLQARLGVATTLIGREEYAEALEVLQIAEETNTQNPAVLSSIGAAHLGAGRLRRSIDYLERAVAIAPTQENRLLLERARMRYVHRVEGTGLFEQFSGNVDDTRGVDVAVNVRVSDTVRVSGRGQRQDKFGVQDTRAGGGIEWMWKPSTLFVAQVLAGNDIRVLAQREVYAEIDYRRGKAQWSAGYRYLDFLGARATIIGPAVQYAVTDRWTLDLRLAAVITEFPALRPVESSPAALARASYRLRPRVSVLGGYARGIENFQAVSIDRVGDFRANTVSGGVQIDMPSLTSLQGRYERQWRPSDPNMGRFSISVVQGF